MGEAGSNGAPERAGRGTSASEMAFADEPTIRVLVAEPHTDGAMPGRPAFTAREWQVLELLRNRLTTAEIADRLVISPITVRSHTQSIRHKLGAASQEEALELISAG
jgi:DNA-binding NarL/FixJ family response regulator